MRSQIGKSVGGTRRAQKHGGQHRDCSGLFARGLFARGVLGVAAIELGSATIGTRQVRVLAGHCAIQQAVGRAHGNHVSC